MLVATLTGNLGGDAETRTVGDDTVTSFSVASTKKLKSGDVTTWVRASIWGHRGEALARFLTKGTPVTVVGELSVREYEKEGEKRHSLEMRAMEIALQGSKGDGAAKPKPQASEDPAWMNEE